MRLSRYAAGLPLVEFEHASFLVNDAVRRNASAGNLLWPLTRMISFVHQAGNLGRHDVAANAQTMVDMMKAQGGVKPQDATVPPGEDIPAFVRAVDSATTPDGIKACVLALLES